MKFTEIKLCPECDGLGHVEHSERVDIHHHIDEYWDETCLKCNGSGRILVTTEIKEEPFNFPEMRKRNN